MNTLADILKQNVSGITDKTVYTENGMPCHSVSTLDDIVRWFYQINDNLKTTTFIHNLKQNCSPYTIVYTQISNEIVAAYKKAIEENDKETLRLLNRFMAFVRDPRKGLGQRNLFRAVASMAMVPTKDVEQQLDAVVNHGRWDDLISIEHANYNGFLSDAIRNKVYKQLVKDFNSLNDENSSVSLLAKWMPSTNTSSKRTVEIAKSWARYLCNSNMAQYRKMLSKLRKRIDITEHYLNPKEMNKLNYEHVPSNAMSRYAKQFSIHDTERYFEYMDNVSKGKAKVNVSASNVVEVYAKMVQELRSDESSVNPIHNEMFKRIVSTDSKGDYLPIIDVSGSMSCGITSNITSAIVAHSIGTMLAKRNKGIFKDLVVLFSDNAKTISFEGYDDIVDIERLIDANETCGGTNVHAVFELLANYIEKYNLPKDCLPTLVIISDCEFDYCSYSCDGEMNPKKYLEERGIKVPKIVFWNTQNRSESIPIADDPKNGVTYLSGFSANIVDMITDGGLSTNALLLKKLNESYWDDAENIIA